MLFLAALSWLAFQLRGWHSQRHAHHSAQTMGAVQWETGGQELRHPHSLRPPSQDCQPQEVLVPPAEVRRVDCCYVVSSPRLACVYTGLCYTPLSVPISASFHKGSSKPKRVGSGDVPTSKGLIGFQVFCLRVTAAHCKHPATATLAGLFGETTKTFLPCANSERFCFYSSTGGKRIDCKHTRKVL